MEIKVLKGKDILATPDDWAIVNAIDLDMNLDQELSERLVKKYPLMGTALKEARRNGYISRDYGSCIPWSDPETGKIILNVIIFPGSEYKSAVNPKTIPNEGTMSSVMYSLGFRIAIKGIKKVIMPKIADGYVDWKETAKLIKDHLGRPTLSGKLAIFV